MNLKSITSAHNQTSTIRPSSITPTRLGLLQIISLVLVINQLSLPVSGNSHEMLDEAALIEGSNEPATDESTAQLLNEVKRSWQSLQGSWGKRDHSSAPALNVGSGGDDYDVSEWNPTGMTEFEDHPKMTKYSIIYASNPNALAAAVAAAATSANGGDGTGEENDISSGFEKKSWKNMNVAWGKRRSAVWNKFRGAWGKREPGWNNLKGMWGKRSSGDWRKLQSAWGKRSQQQ